jgi:TRAP-type C4-dicarboxylate transport system permease small subunit
LLVRLIMGLSSILLFTVTFAAVVFRYLLKMPLPWSQDVIRFAFTYLIYFGAAYCVRENAHLNIDVLLSLLKPRARIAVDIAINVILLAFFVFLVVYGLRFAATGQGQTSSYLMVPMSYYYAGIPIAGGIMTFYMVARITGQVESLLSKDGR